MKHVLEADGIQLSFGMRQILQDVYLRCETGNITGLLGSNGTGKSCLMKIICGTMDAYAQSVRMDGSRLVPKNRCLPNIAYLPQFHCVPNGLKLGRILADYGLAYQDFAVQFPEFSQKQNMRFGALSGGEQRLVEIYIVVASPAKFVLLDEPFTHLMPLHIERITAWLQELKNSKGILISDHLYRYILPIADALYLLKDGKTHLVQQDADLARLGYIRWED